MLTKTIQKIDTSKTSLSATEGDDLVRRLLELGLRPGLEVEIIDRVSFGSVTIIQFDSTRLALNEEELLCLHGL